MALRALNSVVAANYAKLSADPVLAGDIVTINYGSSNASGVNPAPVCRASSLSTDTTGPVYVKYRGQIVGVCADDAVGTNPAGETPTMINNDPAGSNFVNGSTFQSYTAGFYVGVKRAITDFKDESIDVVTNLTAGIPTYSQRGVTVYNTPGSQFVTDRFLYNISVNATYGNADQTTWFNATSAQTSVPQPGDLLSIGRNNATANSYASVPTSNTAGSSSTNNAGYLVSACSSAATTSANAPIVGRVDYYDSGAGLLYWTLL